MAQQPAPQHRPKPLDGTQFLEATRLRGVTIKDFQFSKLSDPESGSNSALQQILDQVIDTTLDGWRESQSRGRPIVPESRGDLEKLLMLPGAITTVLLGPDSEVLGYGLILTRKETFPDLDKIPEDIRNKEKLYRGIRLFVKDKAHERGPFGSAANAIMFHIMGLVGDGSLVTNVQNAPVEYAYPWATRLFKRLGFQFTGNTFSKPGRLSDGSEVIAIREWLVWPPQGDHAREELERHASRVRATAHKNLAELAATAHFSSAGANIAVVGPSADGAAWRLSGLYPRNEYFATELLAPGATSSSEFLPAAGYHRLRTPRDWSAFPQQSLQGILNSGTLAALAKETENDHRRLGALSALLQSQTASLSNGGKLILRDQVKINYAPVLLLLSKNSPKTAEVDRTPVQAFADFLQHSKAGRQAHESGLILSSSKVNDKTVVQYEVPLDLALAFISGAAEPAAYSAEEIEAEGRRQGLRLVRSYFESSHPSTRVSGVQICTLNGKALNPRAVYTYVAEKVAANEGVEIVVKQPNPGETNPRIATAPSFAVIKSYQRVEPGAGPVGMIFDLVEKRSPSLDIIPTFEYGGLRYVVVKDYPRPIPLVTGTALDGSKSGGYVTEQITLNTYGLDLSTDRAVAHAVRTALLARTGIETDNSIEVQNSDYYLTSPGGVNDGVKACLTKISPHFDLNRVAPGFSGFRTPGTIRAVEVSQLLRACHVGGVTDPRTERKLYEYILNTNYTAGPWLGAEISLRDQGAALPELPIEEALHPQFGITFKETEESGNFMEIYQATFSERDSQGLSVADQTFEYVIPRPDKGISNNTIVGIPVIKTIEAGREEFYIPLEIRDLPAVQNFLKDTSWITTVPAFRLPISKQTLESAEDYMIERLFSDFALETKNLWPLGAPTHPSPGIIPETVYSYAVEVSRESVIRSGMPCLKLSTLLEHLGEFPDGHFRTAICRLGHALGLIR